MMKKKVLQKSDDLTWTDPIDIQKGSTDTVVKEGENISLGLE